MNKKHVTFAAVLISTFANADQGLIGGQNGTAAYAATVSSSGVATPITLGFDGSIYGVSVNASGQGLIGGYNGSAAYAATVSSSGVATPIILGINGFIYHVAINESSQGFIGGSANSAAYAAVVSPSGVATPVTIGASPGTIYDVRINASGQGFIGGYIAGSAAYAAVVSPSGVATPITLGFIGSIRGVAILASSQGLIVGQNDTSAYAATVSSGVATPIALGFFGTIDDADINTSGHGLIGGQNGAAAYAATVSSGVATPITLGVNGYINAVAINESSQGLIGGYNGSAAYAAIVSPSGVATPVTLGFNGTINDVAINALSQGVIGGQNGSAAYAAIVSPSGVATPITLGFNGVIYDVSDDVISLLSNIPTAGLTGNNLIFANYINKNAPQDAFYFVPAKFDGTLAKALQSAAPTRNAISLNTACHSLYYLTTTLATHLRHQRLLQSKRVVQESKISAACKTKVLESEDRLTASLDFPDQDQSNVMVFKPTEANLSTVEKKNPLPDQNAYSIWFDTFGTLAYQKAQRQIPAFNPSTGGGILTFNGKTSQNTQVGCGVSYLLTYVHEKQKAGQSHINQEDLFIYASWENQRFYVDGDLLGGPFQISQVRNIHMTGFNYKASSDTKGWQLLPHVELGLNHDIDKQNFKMNLNPFVMLDWANAWQGSYKEKGSSPFNAGQNAHYSSLLRTEAGLRLNEIVYFDSWNLTFQEKGSYVNMQSFHVGKVNAFLVGSPGSFTVETLTSAPNLGIAQLAMIFEPLKSHAFPITTIFYQGEFGVQSQSHQLNLEFAWNF